MRRTRLVLLFVLGVLLASAASAGIVLNSTPTEEGFGHYRWQEVLTDSVTANGYVDYARLRANPRALNAYMDQLALVSPESHPDLFPDQYHQMAYWINAHNALSLRTLVDAYPVGSLAQVPAYRTQIKYKLGGVPYSIAQLQDKIASTYYWQPLVVFALTDTSESAPRLGHLAFIPETLPEQLSANFQAFLARQDAVVIEPDCGSVTLSRVFYQYQPALEQYLVQQRQVPAPSLLTFLAPEVDEGWRAELVKDCPQRQVNFFPWDDRLRQLPRRL